MFKILNRYGKLIGTTETINYLTKNKNNFYTSCQAHEASVIKFNGQLYALPGKGTKKLQEIFIVKTDAGEQLDMLNRNASYLEQELAETDEAAIELYEANLTLEQHNAEQDEAIIEIYELMGGLTNG